MNIRLILLAAATAVISPLHADATPPADTAAPAAEKKQDSPKREVLMTQYLDLFSQNMKLLEGIQDGSQLDKAKPELKALSQKLHAVDAQLQIAPVGSLEAMDKVWNEMFHYLREKRDAVLKLNSRLASKNYFDSEELMDSSELLVKDVDMIRIKDLVSEVDPFYMSYYKNPQPEKIGELMKKDAELIDLTKDLGSLPGKVGFYMEVFKRNPKLVPQWIKEVSNFPPLARQVYLTSLSLVDTPEAKEEVKKYLEHDPLALHMAKNMDKDLRTPKDLDKTENPSALDMAWGSFFGSGDPEYVQAIIRCAVRPKMAAKNTVDVTQQAARWSVKTIGKSNADVKKIADNYLKTRSKEEQENFMKENKQKDDASYSSSVSGTSNEEVEAFQKEKAMKEAVQKVLSETGESK